MTLRLNDEQRAAVETTDRPVMVLAGPGTGKTAMMVEKFRHLATHDGLDPNRILITTFTRKATEELEERIAAALESEGHYSKVEVQNFHSFCLRLLRTHPEVSGLPEDPPILDGLHLRRFLMEHLDRFRWDTVPFVRWIHTPLERLQQFMGACLSAGVDPEDAVARCEEMTAEADAKTRRKADEYLDYARNYGAALELLREQGVLTYDLILHDAVRLLEDHDDILQDVQGSYDHVLVDEVQDNNALQARLVELIVGDRGCVTVVGDEDQGIYKFRGAERGILERFADRFSPQRIDLYQNYRSSSRIVDAARAVISHNPNRFTGKRLEAAGVGKDHDAPVTVTAYRNEEQEALHLAHAIQAAIADGRRPGEIAVLWRSLNHKDRLIDELEARGIRYEVTNVAQLLRLREVRDLWAWMSTLSNPAIDNPAFERVLQSREVGLPLLDLARVQERFHRLVQKRRENARPDRADFDDDSAYDEAVDVFEEKNAELDAEGVPRTTYPNLVDLLRDLDAGYLDDAARHRLRWTRRSLEILSDKVRGMTAFDTAHAILGWLQPQRRFPPDDPRAAQVWANLGDFLTVIKEYEQQYPNANGLQGFLDYLDYLDRQGADFAEREPDTTEDSVKVLTAHGSKGLQWPVVFLPGCNQGRFPSRFRGDWMAPVLRPDADPGAEHMAEERRTFYVAMTRAEQELHLSFALTVGGKEWGRSTFIDELLDASVGVEEALVGKESDLQPSETEASRVDDDQYAAIHAALSEVAADADELADRLRRILQAVAMMWRDRMDVELLRGAFDRLGLPAPEGLDAVAEKEDTLRVEGTLHLSASALNTYAQCPRRFQFQYVLRIPQKINPNAVAGSNVHRALEVFHQRHRDDWRTEPVETLLAIHDEVLAEARFTSPEEAAMWRKRDERILRTYMQTEPDRPGTPTHFEVPVKLRLDDLDVEFQGYIDRVDEHDDGTVEIIDYKTGARKTAGKIVAEDFQVPLYIAAFEAKGRQVKAGTLYWMRDAGDEDGAPIERMQIPRVADGKGKGKGEFTDTAMQAFHERVQETVEGIRIGRFEENVEDFACSHCDYRLLCPAWERDA